MNQGNIIFQLIVVFWLMMLLIGIGVYDQDCIKKKEVWNDEKQKNQIIWIIEGNEYLVRETPHGQHEIIGLYSRYE